MWGYGPDWGMIRWGYGAFGIFNMILWIVLLGVIARRRPVLCGPARRARVIHMGGDLPASTRLRNATRAAK